MTLHWLNPLALAGLAAAALPVIIHLLKRHRAPRVPFPTLRFLSDSRAAAVRLRSLSDPWLLALRVAAIAAAVLAAAQPDVVTSWQRARADRRISRAIVIDTSSSTSAFARMREEAIILERRADAVVEVRTDRAGASLCHAAAALLGGPVARHEVVVISDFQHGAVTDADVACVPPDAGLRFVQIGAGRAGKASATLIGLPADGKTTEQRVEFEGPLTRVMVSPRAAGAAPQPRIVAPAGDAPAVAQLLGAAARAGAPAPPADRPMTFLFPGVPMPAAAPPSVPWMIAALAAAREDPALRDAAASRREAKVVTLSAAWVPVVRSASGAALVLMAAEGDGLVVSVAAKPSDVLAVAAVRAFLTAAVATPDWLELEVEAISPSQLKAWTRAAGPIPLERFEPTPPGDARWLWALALALLCAEWVVRRERPAAAGAEARAA
jgi:Aerotolerance regulator N-terminal